MNSPKVPQLVAVRFNLAEEFAACPECGVARESSESTDAVCFPHYVRMNQRLAVGGSRERVRS